MITIMKHGFYVSLFVVFLLFTNIDARGGGRSGGRGGSRGRSGMHRGGGGLGWDETISPYGKTFDNKGLPDNSYIANNNYKYLGSNGFLISSLFYGAGMQKTDPVEAKNYYDSVSSEFFYKRWDDEKDRKWRETTRAPYFDNKLPGDDKIFPASAVVGAATAFGLVSLLPINVPPGKPLMYCGNTDLIQSKLRINSQHFFVCNKTKIEIECRNGFDHECVNEEVQCDIQNEVIKNIYCSNGTLLSKTHMFCDISRKYFNDIDTTVNCHDGKLPKSQTSFIPTTSTTTEDPYFTTTPQPLSFNANVHVFLLKLMGKSEILETTTPESFPYTDSNAWHPEALTIPPETTTTTQRPTTTKPPYEWMEKTYQDNEDGILVATYRPIPNHLTPYPFEKDSDIPKNWYKIYSSSTEAPYVWMIKNPYFEDQELQPLSKDMIEIYEHHGSSIPFSWVKVPVSKALEIKNKKS